ncbi:MAG: RNA polymerase sigma factor region1.1 domain-containing protein, partial [Burkholderiaceae bacterium]|nr:RNA polymerase sigma factor region1.1 domain-containing protein [Burkholderiaceae bacterium]
MTAKKIASAKTVEPDPKKIGKPATKTAAPAKAAAKAAPKAAARPAAKTARPGPAGKGKSDAAKARDTLDEDFSDIESDIAGEPETAEDLEAKAKAKPLRMKVSRAKERALMREFGLDETALTEEEVTKRRQELKTLIKMGKTRGFLTHQEINDHLP